VTLKLTDVSAVLTACIIRAMIALMIEAVRTSETSVNFNVTTRRYIPEDSKLLILDLLTCPVKYIILWSITFRLWAFSESVFCPFRVKVRPDRSDLVILLVFVLQRLSMTVTGVHRRLYRHCRELFRPWLRLIALLRVGFVKPSTFTETHVTKHEPEYSGHTLTHVSF
jgi:hypothetical protein